MKTVILNIHSEIDLITNSSTEIFILKDTPKLSIVKDILEEVWNEWKYHWKELNKYDPDFLEDNRYYIDAPFEEIFIIRHPTEWEFKEENEYKSRLSEKSTIISGADDNSIPYEFFNVIENVFKVKDQIHLG